MATGRFLKSAVLPRDFPADVGVEIAIAGRSNAGKSSLINVMTGSRLAKISGTPGKTRLLNFFEMNSKYVLVDMPGYGFAARSNDEVIDWQQMIETYLVERQSLRGLILVIDSRRAWSDEERTLKKFLNRQGLPMVIVLTKIDKLTKAQVQKAVEKMKKQAALDAVFPVSALKKTGQIEFEEWLYQEWVKPALEEEKRK